MYDNISIDKGLGGYNVTCEQHHIVALGLMDELDAINTAMQRMKTFEHPQPVAVEDVPPPECPHGRQLDYEHCARCAR